MSVLQQCDYRCELGPSLGHKQSLCTPALCVLLPTAAHCSAVSFKFLIWKNFDNHCRLCVTWQIILYFCVLALSSGEVIHTVHFVLLMMQCVKYSSPHILHSGLYLAAL